MSTTDTGGPAFPLVAETNEYVLSIGVTMRDYFAAKAMAGVLSMDGARVAGEPLAASKHADVIAECAYALADAMLKARQA